MLVYSKCETILAKDQCEIVHKNYSFFEGVT